MNPDSGDSLNPIASTTTSTCAPESNLLSDTQPMVSDDESSNRLEEPAREVEDQLAATSKRKTQIEDLFRQVASEMSSEFPQVPTERILRRATAFANVTDVWVQDEAEFFETVVDSYTDQALKLVTEHQDLQKEVFAMDLQILRATNSVTSEIAKLKEITARLKTIRNSKATIAGKQRLLAGLQQEIEYVKATQVPVGEPIKEACNYLDSAGISD